MLTNRKTQLIGMALLIVAAALVMISAIRVPAPVDLSWPARPDFSILNEKAFFPVTGNDAGLAIYHQSERMQTLGKSNADGLALYHRSERGAPLAATNGLAIYFQSERMQVNPAISYEAGLAQYHRSERESTAAVQNGLDKYHQSE